MATSLGLLRGGTSLLNSAVAVASGPVADLIAEIRADEVRFDRELRSAHREKIVIPIDISRGAEIAYGFTRNLSPQGACVIAFQQFAESGKAKISLYRLGGKRSCVVAECRWCKPYGTGYFLSGWQFQGLTR